MFRKNNITINCDDNDDAICILILGRLLLQGSPWSKISLATHLRSNTAFLSRLKFWVAKKTEDEPAYCPNRNELLQIIETVQKFSLFSKDRKIV